MLGAIEKNMWVSVMKSWLQASR